MRVLIWSSAVIVLVVAAWAQQTAAPEVADYEDAEAYKVYSAALSIGVKPQDADSKTLAILMETKADGNVCVVPDKESESLLSDAISDYNKRNVKTWRLQRQFDLSQPYELISAGEFDTLFSAAGGGGWDKFYERHPGSGGFAVFSAVGFNAEKTVAILSVGHSCGSLCGGGTVDILQKSNGKWSLIKPKLKSTCTWAS